MISKMTGRTRLAFLIFFAMHIPITLIVDGQAFFPQWLYPPALIDLVAWYAETFHDVNMMEPYEPWFVSIVACEILFQLPFFAVATLVLYQGHYNSKEIPSWFSSACLIYGSHTATSLVPIVTTIFENEDTTMPQKLQLFSFYAPWVFFPLWLLYIVLTSSSDDSDAVTSLSPAPIKAKVT